MPTAPTDQAVPKTAAKATPKATLVLLVRHGQTPSTGKILPGRAPGLHLSDTGREQAATVANRLAEWARPDARPKADASKPNEKPRIAAVYASPMERTRETAAPIAAALGLRVQLAKGLLECDFGEWTGAELKKLMKLPEWNTVQRYPSGFRFPGGESFTAMQNRMVTSLAALCAAHPGETVVAVSHADPIKAAVASSLGSHLDHFQRIVISPCSVSVVSYGAHGPTVLAVNSTATLKDLVPS